MQDNIIAATFAPTKPERPEHEIKHRPPMNWCEHCNAGRGKAQQHRMDLEKEETQIPVLSSDYAFLRKADADYKKLSELTIMVLKDRRTEFYGAVPDHQKGVDEHEYSVRRVLR